MKKLLLFLAVFASFAFWACSNDKVAGISTVETENAFLIQIVREDSVPAVNVLARMRSVDFLRSVEVVGSAGDAAENSAKRGFYNEFVTDSLGRIRIDSLAVDVATLEIVDEGEGLFRKISSEDVKDGDSVQFVMEKTGSLRGKVHLPEGVEYAWVQVYGTDHLVKTDADGFYEMDSLPPFEYELRCIVGDSVIENSAKVDAGEEATAFIYNFEPDSVKILDFESDSEEFFITDLGISVEGYMRVTDTNVVTTPDVDAGVASFIEDAGAGREGRAAKAERCIGNLQPHLASGLSLELGFARKNLPAICRRRILSSSMREERASSPSPLKPWAVRIPKVKHWHTTLSIRATNGCAV